MEVHLLLLLPHFFNLIYLSGFQLKRQRKEVLKSGTQFLIILRNHCVKSVQIRSFFWSVFPHRRGGEGERGRVGLILISNLYYYCIFLDVTKNQVKFVEDSLQKMCSILEYFSPNDCMKATSFVCKNKEQNDLLTLELTLHKLDIIAKKFQTLAKLFILIKQGSLSPLKNQVLTTFVDLHIVFLIKVYWSFLQCPVVLGFC